MVKRSGRDPTHPLEQMKKFLTVLTATAVLGAGAYAGPAYASAEITRFNQLANRTNAMNGWSKEYCQVSHEAAELLSGISSRGAWLRFGKNDSGAQHREYQTAYQNDLRGCVSRGLLPSSAAPIAERQPETFAGYGEAAASYLDQMNAALDEEMPGLAAMVGMTEVGNTLRAGMGGTIQGRTVAVITGCPNQMGDGGLQNAIRQGFSFVAKHDHYCGTGYGTKFILAR